MKLKVCHVTSAHSRFDVRIFNKEVRSLKSQFDISIIVGDEFPNQTIDGVEIISTGFKAKNRLSRMWLSVNHIKKLLIVHNADIYHFHDPELLRLVKTMTKLGKKVVFDSHEDYLLTIGEKKWIPIFLRKIVHSMYKHYEKRVIKLLCGAVVCYHWTYDRYKTYIDNVQLVFNYPIINNDKLPIIDYESKNIAYAGGISNQWMHHNLIDALDGMKDVTLFLAGNVDSIYGRELMKKPGWRNVRYFGKISHQDVYENVYGKSSVGVALLDYIPQCMKTIGNLSNTKLFEYMYLGLPVIGTDFQLWKEVIEVENCGVCVNPHDVAQIREAILKLTSNPTLSKQMGENGKKAINEKYNWNNEFIKLELVYKRILEDL
ncbi:MAG: glycosyltransferase [Acholeplasma sp.]|nr:glycosyltransferase [Acholeplasma sp.]